MINMKGKFLHDGNDAKVFSAEDSILIVCSSPVVINSGAMLKIKHSKNIRSLLS